MGNTDKKPIRLWWIAALMVLAIVYRVFVATNDSLANTSPLMAMAFGGGLLLGRRFWWAPAVFLVLSDLALGFKAGIGPGSYTILTTICYTLAAFAGASFGNGMKRSSWPLMWLGTMICSIAFYLIANTFSWALDPGYAKTAAGWWQSQTTGLPGWTPSVFFLRNALIGDTIWCIAAAPLFFWNALTAPRVANAA